MKCIVSLSKHNRVCMKFKTPPKIRNDFNDFLNTSGIEEQVFDCKVFKNWLKPQKVFKERVEFYMDSSKSYYDNSDNRINTRFKNGADIDKGDIIENELGEFFILDWKVTPEINNRASRALRCNARQTIYRRFKEEVDERGIVIKEAGERPIVFEQPMNMMINGNATGFSASTTLPGVNPEWNLNVVCQYNDETKELNVGDYFVFGKTTYIIYNISYTGVILGKENGILVLYSRKAPGGEDVGTIY